VSTIQDDIRAQMTAAWKAGETARRDTLRLLIAAFENARIDLGHPLTDEDALRVLQKEAKQRRESIEEFRKGKREDLVAKEQAELEVIEAFLPTQMGDEELRAVVREVVSEVGASGPGDLGKVMRPLMARISGRADGRRANELAREILGG
jgi:uncharacterized protein YqeY